MVVVVNVDIVVEATLKVVVVVVLFVVVVIDIVVLLVVVQLGPSPPLKPKFWPNPLTQTNFYT